MIFKSKKKLTPIFLTAILTVLIGGAFLVVIGVKKTQASSTVLTCTKNLLQWVDVGHNQLRFTFCVGDQTMTAVYTKYKPTPINVCGIDTVNGVTRGYELECSRNLLSGGNYYVFNNGTYYLILKEVNFSAWEAVGFADTWDGDPWRIYTNENITSDQGVEMLSVIRAGGVIQVEPGGVAPTPAKTIPATCTRNESGDYCTDSLSNAVTKKLCPPPPLAHWVYAYTCIWKQEATKTGVIYAVMAEKEKYDIFGQKITGDGVVYSNFCGKGNTSGVQDVGTCDAFSQDDPMDLSTASVKVTYGFIPAGFAGGINDPELQSMFRYITSLVADEHPIVTNGELATANADWAKIDAEIRRITSDSSWFLRPYDYWRNKSAEDTNYITFGRQIASMMAIVRNKNTATNKGIAAGKSGTELANFVADDQGVKDAKADLQTALTEDATFQKLNTPQAGPALANPNGTCTVEKYADDMMQLIKPFPAGMMCFIEQGILKWLSEVFTGLGELFENILLVNNKTLLSTNEIVITVSDIFVNFINGLFFIVALLSILITTLKIDIPALSLNTWQLKRMIPTIIITMILVNYSLSIANLVIGIMDWLVEQFASIDAGRFFAFGPKVYEVNGIAWGVLWFRILFLVAFLLISLYLLCLLWLRKIVLIVLYMFAPVPYLTNIIPVNEIKQQTGKWWAQFMNWGLMGPMVAVFLYAAAQAIAVSFKGIPQVPLGGDFSKSVEGTGLSLTNMVLVGVLLYMAATVPLKLGGAAMAAVQKQTTGRAGKMASKGAKSIGTGVAKSAKTAGYNIAAGEGRLGKIPGMKQIAGAAITAGRTPSMLKAKQDRKLGEAKKAADDKLAAGKITQRMMAGPIDKVEADKSRDKFMTGSPQQAMDGALDAIKKGNVDKAAGAFQALRDQKMSMDPKVSQAAQDQITQLKNAGVIDLSDPNTKIDTKTVGDAVKWAKNPGNATAMANLKRGFLKGNSTQVQGDLAGISATDIDKHADLDNGLSDMEISQLESKNLPELTYNNSDQGIMDQIKSNASFATRTPAEITAAAMYLKNGNTVAAAAALRVSTTDTAFVGLQKQVQDSQKAAANISAIIAKRTQEIVDREDKTVKGFLDDAGVAGSQARIDRQTKMEREMINMERHMQNGETEKAQRLANSVFMMGKDPAAITQEEMKKRMDARRAALGMPRIP